jgi:hypothetical protein
MGNNKELIIYRVGEAMSALMSGNIHWRAEYRTAQILLIQKSQMVPMTIILCGFVDDWSLAMNRR